MEHGRIARARAGEGCATIGAVWSRVWPWVIVAVVAGALHACAPHPTTQATGADASSPTADAQGAPSIAPRKKALPPPPAFYPTLDHALDRAAENRDCESCHRDIAVEWRASLHQQAFRDPSFVEAFALEPTAFCRNCHAPEVDPRLPLLTDGKPTKLAGFAADDGIACVTCHLPKAGEKGTVTAAMPPGHRPLVPRGLADDLACGGCHQFTFPDSLVRTRTEWMQSTILEHARSEAAGTSCRSCHMPLVADHRSHRFAASRDVEMIRRAARVVATREGDVLVVRLTPGDVGHAFPTGDLLRRLAIIATTGPLDRPTAQRTVFLARHFADEQQVPGIVVRVVKLDDRLGFPAGEARVVRLTLPGAGALPMHFRVVYQRVQTLGAGEAQAKVGGEIVVAEGDVAPP
jgi:nitrate/TMAO reductase-like tetraheme cytochrome c subunit